jgi:hypothetical protein
MNFEMGYERVAIHVCAEFVISTGVLPTVTLKTVTSVSDALHKVVVKIHRLCGNDRRSTQNLEKINARF